MNFTYLLPEGVKNSFIVALVEQMPAMGLAQIVWNGYQGNMLSVADYNALRTFCICTHRNGLLVEEAFNRLEDTRE